MKFWTRRQLVVSISLSLHCCSCFRSLADPFSICECCCLVFPRALNVALNQVTGQAHSPCADDSIFCTRGCFGANQFPVPVHICHELNADEKRSSTPVYGTGVYPYHTFQTCFYCGMNHLSCFLAIPRFK